MLFSISSNSLDELSLPLSTYVFRLEQFHRARANCLNFLKGIAQILRGVARTVEALVMSRELAARKIFMKIFLFWPGP